MRVWKITDKASGMSLEVNEQEIAYLTGGIFAGLGAIALLYWILAPFVLAIFAPFFTLFVLDDFVNLFIAKNILFFLLLGIVIVALKLLRKTSCQFFVRLLFDAYILVAVLYIALFILGMANPAYAFIATLGKYLSVDFFDTLSEWMQAKGLIAAVKDGWFYSVFDNVGHWIFDATMWCKNTFQQVDTSGFQQANILLCLKAMGIYAGLFLLVFLGMIVIGALGIVALALVMGLPYLLAFGMIVLLNKLIFRFHTRSIYASRKTPETIAAFDQQKAEFDARVGAKPSMPLTFSTSKEMAAAGNGYAQMRLAQCYLHGEGTLQNDDEAFCWYEKAAFQGITKAQMMTSLFYFNGFGTKKNKMLAKAWLDTALLDTAFVEKLKDNQDTLHKLLRVRKKTKLQDLL